MKRNVVLAIRGRQTYADQEPEVIELVTEGTMTFRNGGWDISYEESALTGLEGVTTTFRVEPGKVTLTRTGKLRSEMVFSFHSRFSVSEKVSFVWNHNPAGSMARTAS